MADRYGRFKFRELDDEGQVRAVAELDQSSEGQFWRGHFEEGYVEQVPKHVRD